MSILNCKVTLDILRPFQRHELLWGQSKYFWDRRQNSKWNWHLTKGWNSGWTPCTCIAPSSMQCTCWCSGSGRRKKGESVNAIWRPHQSLALAIRLTQVGVLFASSMPNSRWHWRMKLACSGEVWTQLRGPKNKSGLESRSIRFQCTFSISEARPQIANLETASRPQSKTQKARSFSPVKFLNNKCEWWLDTDYHVIEIILISGVELHVNVNVLIF